MPIMDVSSFDKYCAVAAVKASSGCLVKLKIAQVARTTLLVAWVNSSTFCSSFVGLCRHILLSQGGVHSAIWWYARLCAVWCAPGRGRLANLLPYLTSAFNLARIYKCVLPYPRIRWTDLHICAAACEGLCPKPQTAFYDVLRGGKCGLCPTARFPTPHDSATSSSGFCGGDVYHLKEMHKCTYMARGYI